MTLLKDIKLGQVYYFEDHNSSALFIPLLIIKDEDLKKPMGIHIVSTMYFSYFNISQLQYAKHYKERYRYESYDIATDENIRKFIKQCKLQRYEVLYALRNAEINLFKINNTNRLIKIFLLCELLRG